MKNILVIAFGVLIGATASKAGSGTGGSNPPAIEQPLDILAFKNSELVTLETDEGRSQLLVVPGELTPAMIVTKEKSDLPTIALADADFLRLKSSLSVNRSTAKIDAINKQLEIRSYRMTVGNKPDELILLDRRSMIRSQVNLK